MATTRKAVRLIFPHQLFLAHCEAPDDTLMVLIEDDLFFKQFKFHKQKLMLHRVSLQHFAELLQSKGYQVEMLETTSQTSMQQLRALLKKISPITISYYELIDDWLQQRLDEVLQPLNTQVQRLHSPGFLTSLGQIDDYFDHHPNRMQNFYQWQRRRLDILLDNGKPVGGKWSYDAANRKKLPKGIELPPVYELAPSGHVTTAQKWVQGTFAANSGNAQTFHWPVTHAQAEVWLTDFVGQRLARFGPYEDAIAQDQSQLFHSALSPLLNIGLLTPQQVLDEILDYAGEHEVPLASLEGFVRQLIGWREYMRATYVRFGRQMRTSNYLKFDRKLDASWWDGTVGLTPIDTVIHRVLDTAYAHHIERLMILGNSLVLLRIDPDDVYEWFMSLFIDAYDWVMVPNVYAMSQFAAGDMITTKPYISGSNYLLKMSDFKRGDWADTWDALYWQFIHDYRSIIEQNIRSRIVVNLYDRMDAPRKQAINELAKQWL